MSSGWTFRGRFDPVRDRAVAPSITFEPHAPGSKFHDQIERAARWYILRAEHLGTATWADREVELERRLRLLHAAHPMRARSAQELGRIAYAVADGTWTGVEIGEVFVDEAGTDCRACGRPMDSDDRSEDDPGLCIPCANDEEA